MPRQSRGRVAGAGLLTAAVSLRIGSTTTIRAPLAFSHVSNVQGAESARVYAPDENTGRFGGGPWVKTFSRAPEHVLQSDVPCLVADRVRVHLRGPERPEESERVFSRDLTTGAGVVGMYNRPRTAGPNGFRDSLGDQAESHFPGNGLELPRTLGAIPNQWPSEPRMPRSNQVEL